MTDQDKDAAALRVLARDLESLRHRVDLLAEQVGTSKESAASAHRAVVRLTDAVGRLSRQSGSEKTLSDNVFRPTEKAKNDGDDDEERPEPWLTLADPAEAAQQLAGLVEWLNSVYVHYPDGQLGECWAWHPSVVAELLALQGAWLEAHEGERASAAAQVDWHDRHRPGVARRIGEQLHRCGLARHAPGHESAPRPARLVGADLTSQIARQWATTHDVSAAPAPTPGMLAEARARLAEQNSLHY